MTKSTIPLAKSYDPKKLNFPVYVSKKEDGVPVKITVTDGYKITWESRSGKALPSLSEYMRKLSSIFQQRNTFARMNVVIVAEITHDTLTDFKDISGIVRKNVPQENLIFNVFDYCESLREHEDIAERWANLSRASHHFPPWMGVIKQVRCDDMHQLKACVDNTLALNPKWEGLVARSHDATFKPNSRHWDYQKIVIDPTIDLRIIDVEEAVDKHGEPKGMVGRLVAEYKGKRIGIGPGKLTHKERKSLWVFRARFKNQWLYPPAIATIKYKRDQSYAALRQPTFQHWRPEKTEESYF